MNEITIQIAKMDELIAAVNTLAGELRKLPAVVEIIGGTATTAPIPAIPAETPPSTVASVPAAPVPVTVPVAAAPAYTLEQIMQAGLPLLDAGRGAELEALKAQFGIQSVPDLKPEQYGAFATTLRGLGAQL